MIDFLIIGSGLAGLSFAEKALQENKKIIIIDDNSQNSSKIAAGLYNPVILKRFSEVKGAQEQLFFLSSFFESVEKRLQVKVNFKTPILRKFFSVEEQNNWFIASDKPNLSSFLSLDLISEKYNGIESPFNYGEVLQTGYVDCNVLLNCYKDYLKLQSSFLYERFDYDLLKITDEFISYKDINAKNIIFAEGFGLHANPFFNNLPLDGTKGELLIIKAPSLKLNVIVNTSVFILPLGNDLFKVGATYNWSDKTNIPSEDGKIELVERINEILDCDFEIMDHFAGVRPTVRDRKPLVGTHSIYKNIHVLNGLGTRGVMLGPTLANALFNHIELDIPLDKEYDIKRFTKKY